MIFFILFYFQGRLEASSNVLNHTDFYSLNQLKGSLKDHLLCSTEESHTAMEQHELINDDKFKF